MPGRGAGPAGWRAQGCERSGQGNYLPDGSGEILSFAGNPALSSPEPASELQPHNHLPTDFFKAPHTLTLFPNPAFWRSLTTTGSSQTHVPPGTPLAQSPEGPIPRFWRGPCSDG